MQMCAERSLQSKPQMIVASAPTGVWDEQNMEPFEAVIGPWVWSSLPCCLSEELGLGNGAIFPKNPRLLCSAENNELSSLKQAASVLKESAKSEQRFLWDSTCFEMSLVCFLSSVRKAVSQIEFYGTKLLMENHHLSQLSALLCGVSSARRDCPSESPQGCEWQQCSATVHQVFILTFRATVFKFYSMHGWLSHNDKNYCGHREIYCTDFLLSGGVAGS